MSSNNNKRLRKDEEDVEEEEFGSGDEKPSKAPASNEKKKPRTSTGSASGGESVFPIGGKRKVTVSEFKGKVLVNIREFYEDRMTGEEKPGNKGIALNKEQWESLRSQMDDIQAAVDQFNR